MKFAFMMVASAVGFSPLGVLAQVVTPDELSSYLLVSKNRYYGPFTAKDVEAAQKCKDTTAKMIENGGNTHAMRALQRAEPAARELVALAINHCLRDNDIEGVHVYASNIKLGQPLLR